MSLITQLFNYVSITEKKINLALYCIIENMLVKSKEIKRNANKNKSFLNILIC